jgi:hypothetical protein
MTGAVLPSGEERRALRREAVAKASEGAPRVGRLRMLKMSDLDRHELELLAETVVQKSSGSVSRAQAIHRVLETPEGLGLAADYFIELVHDERSAA